MQQRKDDRAKQFLSLRTSFRENTGFQNIVNCLYDPNNNFSSVPENVKYEFMAFFEDLAFLMNSGLIKKEVAFYMFGNDVITAWNNSRFWSESDKENKLWSLLKDFVDQMEKVNQNFIYDRKEMSL
jgi:hypothetical protein